MPAAACVPEPYEFSHNIDEKAWKKALGVFTTKTGVSEKIRAVVAGYKKIDVEKLDSQTCLKGCFAPAEFEKAREDAKQYLDKSLHHLMGPVDDLRVLLEEKIPEFQKSKLCPKSTVKFAEGLLKSTKEYRAILENAFKELERDFGSVTKQKLKNFGIAAAALVKYINIWDDGLKKLQEDIKSADDSGKLEFYDVFRRHYVRGFGTSLPFFAKDPNLKGHLKTWQTLSQDSSQPKEANMIDKLIALMDKKYIPALRSDMIKSGIEL